MIEDFQPHAGELHGVEFAWVPEIDRVAVDVSLVGGQHFTVALDWHQACDLLLELAEAVEAGDGGRDA